MEEPKRETRQITGNEQSQIIRAGLMEISPSIFDYRPIPNDSRTMAQLFEDAILDGLPSPYSLDAVPQLFLDMYEAAKIKMAGIPAQRGAL